MLWTGLRRVSDVAKNVAGRPVANVSALSCSPVASAPGLLWQRWMSFAAAGCKYLALSMGRTRQQLFSQSHNDYFSALGLEVSLD
jgi:hypothetical protein